LRTAVESESATPAVGMLKSGKLRDLRSGDVVEPTGQDVRICINTAEGDVELEL